MSALLLDHAGIDRTFSFEKVVEGLDPDLVKPDDKVAQAFAQWRSVRDLAEALEQLEKLAAEQPENATLQYRLGGCYRDLKRGPEAVAAYRRCLALDPDHDQARHMLAALGGGEVPTRAGDRYVANLFDSFADRFDETLVHWLDYRGPQVVHDAVMKALGQPPAKLDILDLGCGTGLAAPLFKPLARRLDGVDLSAGMLAKARERRLYDLLAEREILDYLQNSNRRYDLIVAPDVFVYFGELASVFAASFATLRPGGLFCFTLERADDRKPAFVLRPTGRYAHNGIEIRRLAEVSGFQLLAMTTPTVRLESKQPVPAWCVTLQRP